MLANKDLEEQVIIAIILKQFQLFNGNTEKYGIEIDIMIEAKMKEQAIFKLYEKYHH